MNNLNVNEKIDYIVKQIKSYMKCTNGKNAVIGISGGKDSTVCAALCVKALGKENVIGVLMPNGYQNDINDSYKICEFLGIEYLTINIRTAYNSIISYIENQITYPNKKINKIKKVSKQTELNLPPRIRMSTLYAVAQSVNGRVMNTTNACEAFVGYGTLWGDTVGDYAPLKYLTVDEILEIGDALGLPKELVHKTPSDGLTGKSDEEILGVSYSDIGKFYKAVREINKSHDNGKTYFKIKNEIDKEIFEKIEKLHNKNKFKSSMIKIPGPEF